MARRSNGRRGDVVAAGVLFNPQIADHIRTAIEEVYQGADPKQSLDKAVEDSMKVLGWK